MKFYKMFIVIKKMCIYDGCSVRPNYNAPGETKGLYCSPHKLDGMVNVLNKTCIHPECKVRPAYNIAGLTKGLYCADHKLDGMINVISPTCIHPECKVRPSYNSAGATKCLYCAEHKLDGMVDISNKTCIQPECKVRPSYNTAGATKGVYCVTHKLDGMVNVKDKTCIHLGCKVLPVYNTASTTNGLYCSNHKLDGMMNVMSPTCKSEWCLTQVYKGKYDGYCLYCYMNLFPDKPVTRNYKTKEYAVVEYVKTQFPDLNWIADKSISGGCSKRRPDLLLDLGYQIIIIEIDENQHTDYDCSCENKRIMELSRDLGHRSIVFIRFNPDDYDKNGTNITSCWGLNKMGICSVKKSKRDEWSSRLSALEEHIKYWINLDNMTNKTIETIQLFYDVS